MNVSTKYKYAHKYVHRYFYVSYASCSVYFIGTCLCIPRTETFAIKVCEEAECGLYLPSSSVFQPRPHLIRHDMS